MKQELSIDSSSSLYDGFVNQVNDLMAIGRQLESSPVLQLNTAMEADAIVPSKDILSIYFGAGTKTEKHQIATESIRSAIVDSIVMVYKYIADAIKKFVGYITKSFSGDKFEYSEKQVTQMRNILSSPDLINAVDEVFDLAKEAGHTVSLEDNVQRRIMDDNVGQVAIQMIFDAYKRSLTDSEIDFLTSGHRYKIIKSVIEDFTNNNYPDFVKHMTHDVERLIESSLDKAPHIGKDPDVVDEFIQDVKHKLINVESRYTYKVSVIHEMLKICNSTNEIGVPDHVDLFQKKPSALFPHIEKLWAAIKFEKINAEEKKLISSLNDLRTNFDAEAKKLEKRLDANKIWPAQEAVLKIAQKTNKEVLEHLHMLVRVCGYIKHSAEIAYRTTVKSFSYLSKLLFAIGGLPNVDKEKLMKCIGIIQQKRAAFDKVSTLH